MSMARYDIIKIYGRLIISLTYLIKKIIVFSDKYKILNLITFIKIFRYVGIIQRCVG